MQYTPEMIQSMTMSEYAAIRNTLYSQVSDVLWPNKNYSYYREMFVQTGDETYLERMIEKVEIDD